VFTCATVTQYKIILHYSFAGKPPNCPYGHNIYREPVPVIAETRSTENLKQVLKKNYETYVS